MSHTLTTAQLSKIEQAVADFQVTQKDNNLQPGTADWEAAVVAAVEMHQLQLEPAAFVECLERGLSKKIDGCIRDGMVEKCKEGPWFGAKCTCCGRKSGKPEAPGRDVAATR